MINKWEKLGQLYDPSALDRHEKLLTHAANPLPVHLDGDVYRVFYSGRDKNNRSSVAAVDIDIVRGAVVDDHYNPLFEFGEQGSFYSDGVSIGNCYRVGDIHYMLFMGWQNPEGAHWKGDIGRLIVSKDVRLSLDSSEPFLSTESMHTMSLSYPWVMPSKKGGYDMWYGATQTWDAGNGEMLHPIKHARSDNGDNWFQTDFDVPFEIGRAQAFSRPTVIGDQDNGFHMWFSYRSGNGETYRIGYAFSNDCLNWSLDLDNSGIDVSATGWDSEMIEYPFVFDHNGARYMLYNGNSYGKTGFGLAILTHV